MNRTFTDAFYAFKTHYHPLLENFLQKEEVDEDLLNEGYRMGREAVLNHLNVLSLAAVHQDCLIDYLQKLNTETHVEVADKANLLFDEVLASVAMLPTENFREAIQLLNKRSVEFAVRIRGLQEAIRYRKRVDEETTRIKNDFLANMSHELRTPLNAIIGFTELMYYEKTGSVISSECKEYLGDVLSSAHHLLQLINEILDLAKVEAGKMEFCPEMIILNEIISEVCDSMGALIAEKQMIFEKNLDETLTHIVIDPNKMKQILYNLLSNAIKYTHKKGHIIVSTHHEGYGKFRLDIQDNGIGISEDKIDKLFVPFQQLDSSSSKQYQGTGLGLALTRRLVEAQGGEIGVKSTLHEGSTFFVILPCAPLHVVTKNEGKKETPA